MNRVQAMNAFKRVNLVASLFLRRKSGKAYHIVSVEVKLVIEFNTISLILPAE